MEISHSVWIVDDELDNFEAIRILLFREGYQLSYLPNGLETLSRLEESQPDVILLDVMMPELDGIEVCKRIKTRPSWQHIPIIIITALTSKEDLAHCLNAGADDFLGKPVNGVELRARVRSMLRIKQHHDQLEKILREKEELLQVKEAMLQLRQDMANMVVHDLRNPLYQFNVKLHKLI